jgi:hypothetical protein
MKPKIEYDDKGRYRIVFPDGTTSEWEGYTFVCTGIWKKRRFIAFSKYWDGSGVFPMEGVHELAVT